MRKVTFTLTSGRRRTSAKRKIGSLARPVTTPVLSCRPAPAYGATMPTRSASGFSPAERYATGLRNGEGFAFDGSGRLFVTNHGRDQLLAELAEALYARAKRGIAGRGSRSSLKQYGDYGWPECYYDGFRESWFLRRNMAETGKKATSAQRKLPRLRFFRDWAPNALIYMGRNFRSLSGWCFCCLSRLVGPRTIAQGGYNVIFQPTKEAGLPLGSWSSPTASPARWSRAAPSTAPPGWRWGRTAHSTFRRQARPYLARDLPRRIPCDDRGSAGVFERRQRVRHDAAPPEGCKS